MQSVEINTEYYTVLLKTAESLARSKELFFRDFAILPVGIGVEQLLRDLFVELQNIDEMNRGNLSKLIRRFSRKNNCTHFGKSNSNLTFYSWIEFYEHCGIFGMLEDEFGWEFDRFNCETLHDIRRTKNLYHNHYKDRNDMRGYASTMCEAFGEILIETNRIVQPTVLALNNHSLIQRQRDLALIPSEITLLKQHVGDKLQSNPADVDALLLQAYCVRGNKLTAGEIKTILESNYDYSEAPKEGSWQKYHSTAERQRTQNSVSIYNQFKLTQIRKVIINIRLLDVVVVFAFIALLAVLLERPDNSTNADLQRLQTTVITQTMQLAQFENELNYRDSKFEAIEANLQQLQTMTQTEPIQLAETVRDLDNKNAPIPIGINDNSKTQESPQGEPNTWTIAVISLIITLSVVWILFRRFLPRLLEWILAEFVLPRFFKLPIKLFGLLLMLSVREIVGAFISSLPIPKRPSTKLRTLGRHHGNRGRALSWRGHPKR